MRPAVGGLRGSRWRFGAGFWRGGHRVFHRRGDLCEETRSVWILADSGGDFLDEELAAGRWENVAGRRGVDSSPFLLLARR